MNKFAKAFHIPGTLSANLDIRFAVSAPCTLVHVSAVTSNDSDATMELGDSVDPNGFLVACVVGDSQVPVEKEWGDFDGALVDAGKEPPHLDDGDIFVITIDYDGATGTAGDDLTIVLEFEEG